MIDYFPMGTEITFPWGHRSRTDVGPTIWAHGFSIHVRIDDRTSQGRECVSNSVGIR